jgi:uncharacterized membrane protein YphA (DoxX/SURF4 family)
MTTANLDGTFEAIDKSVRNRWAWRLVWVSSWVTAVYLIVAGLMKVPALIDPAATTQANLFSRWTAAHPALPGLVVAGEVLLGMWLMSGLFRRAALSVALMAMMLFLGVVGAELRKDDPVACGCLGGSSAKQRPEDVRHDLQISGGRNALLVFALFTSLALLSTGRTGKTDGERIHTD